MEIVCLVCNKTLQQDANISVTPCGHMFHTDCLVPVGRPERTTTMCAACRKPITDPTATVRLFVESSFNNLSACEKPSLAVTPRRLERNHLLHDSKDELQRRLRELEQQLIEEDHTDIVNRWQIETLRRKCKRQTEVAESNRRLKVPLLKLQLARMPREETLTATLAEQRSRIQQLKDAIEPCVSDGEVTHLMHTGQSVKSMKAKVIVQKKVQIQSKRLASKDAQPVSEKQAELAESQERMRVLKQREAQLSEAIADARKRPNPIRERSVVVMPSTPETPRMERQMSRHNTPQRAVLQKADSMGMWATAATAGDAKKPQVKALDALQNKNGRRNTMMARSNSAVI